jgi:hypothetical protein
MDPRASRTRRDRRRGSHLVITVAVAAAIVAVIVAVILAVAALTSILAGVGEGVVVGTLPDAGRADLDGLGMG